MVGNRIAILSPHPGRLRAEINAHSFDLASSGSAAFQAAHQRIHRLLFDEELAIQTDDEAPASSGPVAKDIPHTQGGGLRRAA